MLRSPGAYVGPASGRTDGEATHRRWTLEFGSAVGEVARGRLVAHWFQLQRGKGHTYFQQSWESSLGKAESMAERPPNPRLGLA